mgnify:CR=1 FL=1
MVKRHKIPKNNCKFERKSLFSQANSLLFMSTYSEITSCISEEMARYHEEFERILHTRIPLADNIIRYFLDRKGKQMRPIMAILAAKIAKGTVTDETINGAVALELLHNASLMHDDVVDNSDQRRGVDTINKVWDNHIAVLMGDFFLAKCLVSSNAPGSLTISRMLADMVIRLAEGELEQQANARAHMMSENAYFSVISGKTASLFSGCLKIGAISVGASEKDVEKLGEIGELMGLVFQIRDDIFDYFPSTDEVGKPTGHDILEGKITLPLIFALNQTSNEENQKMRRLVLDNKTFSQEQISQLVEYAKAVGGIDYAQAKMKNLAFKAKNLLLSFEDSEYRTALMTLLDYFIERQK